MLSYGCSSRSGSDPDPPPLVRRIRSSSALHSLVLFQETRLQTELFQTAAHPRSQSGSDTSRPVTKKPAEVKLFAVVVSEQMQGTGCPEVCAAPTNKVRFDGSGGGVLLAFTGSA